MQNNQLTPFCFGDQLVRVFEDDNGDPWFVAKDVCKVLDIQNASDTVRKCLDEDEKADVEISYISSNGVTQRRTVLIISESGLYALIFRSRKPEAKAFSKWARSVVLPQIRKTGRYGATPLQPNPDEPELPPHMLGLRPSMRQKIFRDAIRMASLDNGSSGDALQWFDHLCRLVAASPPAPDTVRDKVEKFWKERCKEAPDNVIACADLYEAFRSWHAGEKGYLPTKKTFSVYMQQYARRRRSNGTVFDGIALK